MKILVTKKLPYMPDFAALGYQTYINQDQQLMSYDQIKNEIKDASALVSVLADKIDQEIIDAAQLRNFVEKGKLIFESAFNY